MPPEPEDITVPEDIDSLDEQQARDLHARLQERYDALVAEAKTPQQVEALRGIRAQQAQLAGRVQAIYDEQAQVQSGLEELATSAVELPEPPSAETPAPGKEGEEPVTPAPTATTATAAPAAAAPAARAASVGIPNIAEGQTAAAAQSPTAQPARPKVGYVAAVGQPEVQANEPVDFEQIGRMLQATKSDLLGATSHRTAFVAALPAFEDTAGIGVEPLSRSNGVESTDRMIREAVDDWRVRDAEKRGGKDRRGRVASLPEGRTAAICEPLDIIRDIPNCSMDDDPFGDSLPQRPAGRLGFQFTQAPSLSLVSPGVTAGWDDARQALVDPTDQSTWKPCVDIDCPTPESIKAEEIVACVRFDVTTELSNPEFVEAILNKLTALRTRVRTQHLLAKADALASGYTFESTYDYGAFPALIEAAMSALPLGTYDERTNPGDYNIYLPPGLVETLVTDLVGRAYNDPLARDQAAADILASIERLTDATGVRLWDVRGANPFDALNPPGQAPIALPAVGCQGGQGGQGGQTFRVRFLAPEAALFFSTGEEKTGLESSPELLRQNKSQLFSREWVGLAKHGCHAWMYVDMVLNGNGARTGFTTPVACP